MLSIVLNYTNFIKINNLYYNLYDYNNLHNISILKIFSNNYDLYITKDFIDKYKKEFLSSFLIFLDNEYNINLYCDFIDDDKLIEEIEYNISNKNNFKFNSIKENKHKLLSLNVVMILELLLKSSFIKKLSNYCDGIAVDNYNMYFYDKILNINNITFISLSQIYKKAFKNKKMILKYVNLDKLKDLELNDIFDGIILNKKDEVIFDTSKTIIGLLKEYLKDKNTFNKNINNIKYFIELDNKEYFNKTFEILKNNYNNLNNEIKDFLLKIGILKNFLNIFDEIISEKMTNSYLFIIKDNKMLDFIIKYYCKLNLKQQKIYLNALMLYKNELDKFPLFLINFLIYYKNKELFSKKLNITFYILNNKLINTIINNSNNKNKAKFYYIDKDLKSFYFYSNKYIEFNDYVKIKSNSFIEVINNNYFSNVLIHFFDY